MSELDTRAAADFDVVVVGAGFAGLYALHKLRSKGLSVRVLEAADGIGGTWYWNGYPGARCDVESVDYSYSFSPELDQEWTWTERYASQPEILRYMEHVADRFCLRDDIQLNTRVKALRWERDGWTIDTEAGAQLRARFVVLATGTLSAPLRPNFPGVDTFAGESYMTQTWPREPVDFTGKRVAVIGTGSSGIQAVPVIAEQAAAVTVFQRTANFSVPGRNRTLDAAEVAAIKADYPAHRAAAIRTHAGVMIDVNRRCASEMTPEEQQAELGRRWLAGGALPFTAAFRDVITNLPANELVQNFIREKIRGRVAEPALGELLCPDDHPFGVKRPCVDHGYYEAFNRDGVTLVQVRDNPITAITPRGIALRDGTEYDVDVIVYAMGYDAITGAIGGLDIRGRDGASLSGEWSDGPRTYLGLAFAGFPNMFSLTGPGSTSVLGALIQTAEMQVDWIADAIDYLGDQGATRIEANVEGQDNWTGHLEQLAAGTLHAGPSNSYYRGANVPGKPNVFPIYLGGHRRYRRIFADVAAKGYPGFTISGPGQVQLHSSPSSNVFEFESHQRPGDNRV